MEQNSEIGKNNTVQFHGNLASLRGKKLKTRQQFNAAVLNVNLEKELVSILTKFQSSLLIAFQTIFVEGIC